MKPYAFEIQAEVIAIVPGRLTVNASSFEEAVRLATDRAARYEAVLDEAGAEFEQIESLDFSSVSDGSGVPVEFCWSSTQGQPPEDEDLAAVRKADTGARSDP